MAQEESCEIRLMAEIHVPNDRIANRIDVYDWIVGLVSDWAMAAPEERVTTGGTFAPDGDKLRNREMVIDIIESNSDVGKVAQHK